MDDIDARTNLQERLIRLIEAKGVSGFEANVQQEIESQLLAVSDVKRDRLGNLWTTSTGTSQHPYILLEAHSDEIGFLVSAISPDGYLRFSCIGAWPVDCLASQRVHLQGRSGIVPGVISVESRSYPGQTGVQHPPAFERMFIDVGARDAEEIQRLGIRIGTPVIPAVTCDVSADGRTLFGKALDNRVGVSVMIETYNEVTTRRTHPNVLTAAATVQEEIGRRGVTALEQAIRPDAAIVFEAIAASDTPSLSGQWQPPSALGQGPNIIAYDEGMIVTPSLLDWAVDLASHHQIPFQITPAFGINNAERLQLGWGGTPTLVIGVPCRYIHTTNGAVRLEDYHAAIRLATVLVENLNSSTLEEINRSHL